jgi:hypothetical protein
MDKGVSATGSIVPPVLRRLFPASLKIFFMRSQKPFDRKCATRSRSGRDETHQAHAELTRRRGVSLEVIRGGIAGVMHE